MILQDAVEHSEHNYHSSCPDMQVRYDGPAAEFLVVRMVEISEYDLRYQDGNDDDSEDLVCCTEGRPFDALHAKDYGNDKAKNTNGCSSDLEDPVCSEEASVAKGDCAQGEEQEEGAREQDGVYYNENAF